MTRQDKKSFLEALNAGKIQLLDRSFENHPITHLYIVKAHLRGKLHRRNPPATVRDRNRAHGRPEDHGWDAETYARGVFMKAEKKWRRSRESISSRDQTSALPSRPNPQGHSA